ncbi:MAG: hypothetical protein E7672_03250 [Ruminococcaceae bacterium]|nr:hypothetical protein [Oscillospiraceae bacterium]
MIKICFSENGTLTLSLNGRQMTSPSPIGMALLGDRFYVPQNAKIENGRIMLGYEIGQAVLSVNTRPNGSVKLVLLEASDGIDGFMFGPYYCPGASECGESIGAAWFDDGAAVCIQSLNPKTVGGFAADVKNGQFCYPQLDPSVPLLFRDSKTWADSNAARWSNDKSSVILFCSARDMSTFEVSDFIEPNINTLWRNVDVEAVQGEDGKIVGAAIILTAASDADSLLEDIGQIEIEEGLPHPTIDGEWARTSPRLKDIYFVVGGEMSREEQLAMAKRAGVSSLYYGNPFETWGHFEINKKMFPGGEEEFGRFIEDARAQGIRVGFHTLTNFINTADPYVTPVPHKELLVMDRTALTADLGEDDTVLYIADLNNYETYSTVQVVRIGDELIKYGCLDKESMCLIDCERGAFGTVISSHCKGDDVSRLFSHGYGTLFPSIILPDEMAERIGAFVRKFKLERLDFDGIEGCAYTGRGEYALSRFVDKVYEASGNELLTGASGPSHYRWHSHGCFNWGEPWYDHDRRGGRYNYRVCNLNFYKRNLLPNMFGWFAIYANTGRYEATLPENIEFQLSRTVAFDAGLCFSINNKANGRFDEYMDMIRLWTEFNHSVDVPDDIRTRMEEETSNWHLEKQDSKWVLSEMTIDKHSLNYCENTIATESGTTGYINSNKIADDGVMHHSWIVLDYSSNDPKNVPFIIEPYHVRLRVGTPLDKGEFRGLDFFTGYGGNVKLLGFEVSANPGDYLEYEGGLELKHYDANFNLIETVRGEGNPLTVNGGTLFDLTYHYFTSDPDMEITLTTIRTKQRFEFPIE